MTCVEKCDQGFYEDDKYCYNCLAICDNSVQVLLDPPEKDKTKYPTNGVFLN